MFVFEIISKFIKIINSVGFIIYIDEYVEWNKDFNVVLEIMGFYFNDDFSEFGNGVVYFEGVNGVVRKRENMSFGEEDFCIRVIGKK